MAARLVDRIVADPRVMMGKPVIKGARIPVELILRRLGAGDSDAQILADHPGLQVEDIRAAQAFATSSRVDTDEEAERFVATADLAAYDFSGFQPRRFEFEPKAAQINMRVPQSLIDAL